MIIFKKKGSKFDQKSYDNFFHNIENNLRELGFGDVSVNKKMKELNKEEKDSPKTVNNALFVGSTSELSKLLKNGVLNNKVEKEEE